MVKRILLLGLAVAALAIALPAIVAQSGLGGDVAQAQTPPPTTDPDDQADPPEAPDQADPPDAPDTPDQGDTPGEDDEGSEDDEDEEQTPAPPAGNNAGGSEPGRSGTKAPQTPLGLVSAQRVSGVDSGTIPQDGIQAGAGGTADEGSPSALLLGLAALMLMLTAGGLVLRRRGFES